jgi:hypothetical protein
MRMACEKERRAKADIIQAVVRTLSPDDRLMALYMVAAQVIHANYRGEAHELLAAMAQHDVFEFLLAISIEHDLERNSSLRRAA